MVDLIGKTLGKYQITELLGKGGMAEVYKAYHPKLGRYVTIKILHSYLAEGENFLARFEREARTVAALRHPHIVQIHDFDVEDNIYYMVMEFIDGGTLQARMTEVSKAGAYMPVQQVLSILRQVADALDYAHKQGVIHRDIKPSNILLDSSGNAFLTDFGIARIMSGTQFTATGVMIGTPTYMSPEQGSGLEISNASDIYSLGIILYELLTGRAPYTADTPLAVIFKHVNETLPSPRALRPDLPAAVEGVIIKALAKDPKERYQSASAMVQDLEKALTPENIAKLDASGAGAAVSASALPTIQVDGSSSVERANLPTVAMSEETRAVITEPPMAKTVKPVPVEQKPAVEERKPSPTAKQPESGPVKKVITPSWFRRLKLRWVIFIGIGLVIVATILVLVFSHLIGGVTCSTVEQCQLQAEQSRSSGDLAGYIKYIDKTLALVPDDQHPPHAGLWCDRGDIEKQLGQKDQAVDSYNHCVAWTNNAPDLQPLRDRAANNLAQLR